MDLSAIQSADIPDLVRGHNAAGNGEPFDPDENAFWQAAYLLHPRAGVRLDVSVEPCRQKSGLVLTA